MFPETIYGKRYTSLPRPAHGLLGTEKQSRYPQFNADLITWETPAAAQVVVVADDGLVEACGMSFPAALSTDRKPMFFRLTVRDSALAE